MGTVQQDFRPSVFFIIKISLSYLNFRIEKKLTPRSIILCGVKKNLVLELFNKIQNVALF